MTTGIARISVARAEHLLPIASVERAAAQRFSDVDLPPTLKHSVTDAAFLQDAIAQERLWIASTDSGKTVGFSLAGIVDGQSHLYEIGVHPEFGRCGIGTRLVQTVIEWSNRQGCRDLTLVTFSHIPWNAPFYRKFGFDPIDENAIQPEMRALIAAEAMSGINISKRVGMKLTLRGRSEQSV